MPLAARAATSGTAHPALELDHVVCMVDDLDQPSRVLERDGWVLDAGTVHVGQGTRNRRLAWPDHHLELLCVTDEREAASSRLRLDRRARWSDTGASPFGVGLRGVLTRGLDDFWLYEEGSARIWIHRDNERAPQRPMLFVLEVPGEEMERRRPRSGPPALLAHRHGGPLAQVRIDGPAPVPLPPYAGPPVVQSAGPPNLELVVGTGRRSLPVTPILTIRSDLP